MPRPEAEIKAGFYALPESIAPLIAERIELKEENDDPQKTYRVIDPCCGEGVALDLITKRLSLTTEVPMVTYGIELQADRAAAAAQRLEHVLHGDIFAAETGLFDILYLNPPYDGRIEVRFLERAMDMLKDAGLAVLVVQKKTVRALSKLLAAHFHNLKVREFPMPERAVFGQVVITASKNPGYVAMGEKISKELRAYAEGDFGRELYQFRTSDLSDRIKVWPSASSAPDFQLSRVSARELLSAARQHGHWTDELFTEQLEPARGAIASRPLAPLRMGHLAQYCAAGLLNNSRVEDIVICGTATKTRATHKDEEKEVVREKIELTVMALDLNNWTTYKIN